MQKPKVGSAVLVEVDPRVNNGEDVAPALVTRVKEDEGDTQRVNLRVFLDTGDDQRLSNVELASKRPDSDEDRSRVAFWPSRH